MLVLTRRAGEGVELTDRDTGEVIATVKVLFTRIGEATLGFEAPERVHILRDDAVQRTARQEP